MLSATTRLKRAPRASAFLILIFVSTACDFVDSGGRQANEAPDVVASDQIVAEGNLVVLDGAATQDDFGDFQSSGWTQQSGIPVELAPDPNDSALARFTAPVVDRRIELGFVFMVVDRDGAQASKSITVTINDRPTAEAGEAQLVNEGTTAELPGLASDTDGVIAGFLWEQLGAGTAVTLEKADTAAAQFVVPPVTQREDLEFQFTARDSDGATSFDTVVITVNASPRSAPSAGVTLFTEDGGAVLVDGEFVALDVDGSELMGATLTIPGGPPDGALESLSVNTQGTGITAQYEAASGVLRLSNNAPIAAYEQVLRTLVYDNADQDPEISDRQIQFQLIDQDLAPSAAAAKTLTITAVNDPPIITGQSDLSVLEDSSLLIGTENVTVTDPDNVYPDDFTLEVLDGDNYSHSGATITPSPNFDGTLRVRVRVNDGFVDSNTFNLTVAISGLNDPPVLGVNRGLAIEEGARATIGNSLLSTLDLDNRPDQLIYRVTGGPSNGILRVGGQSVGSFTQADVDNNRLNYQHDGSDTTTDSFRFEVNDGAGGSITGQTFNISVQSRNDPPRITGQIPLTTPEETALTLKLSDVTVVDPDSGSNEFSLIVLDGDRYSRSGSTITPATDVVGTLTVPVRVSDGQDNSEIFPLNVEVTALNDPPVITGQEPLSTLEETPLTITLSDLKVSDPDNSFPSDFSLIVSDGANYTRSASTITPVANFADTLTVPVRVNDGRNDSNTFGLEVSVTANKNKPPKAKDDGAAPITVGQSVVIGVLNNDNDPDGSLDPTSVSIATQPANGTAQVNADGTVTYTNNGVAGSDSFTYTVNDNEGETSNVAKVTVTVSSIGADDLSNNRRAVKQAEKGGSETVGGCWTTSAGERLLGVLLGGDEVTPKALNYELATPPTKGDVSITDVSTGAFVYTPFGTETTGIDRFAYRVTDVAGVVVTLTVSIIIDPRIMALGDSVTTGLSNVTNQLPVPEQRVGYRKVLYQALIAAGYNVDFVGSQTYGTGSAGFDADNEGHENWSAAELAAGSISKDPNHPDSGIYYWLTEHPAEFILLHIGTDALDNGAVGVAAILDEIERWERDFDGEVRLLVARIIDRIPADVGVARFNTELETLLNQRYINPDHSDYPDRLKLVNQQAALATEDGTPDPAYYGDGVYPNAAGYARMAEVWLQAIEARCKSPKNLSLP